MDDENDYSSDSSFEIAMDGDLEVENKDEFNHIMDEILGYDSDAQKKKKKKKRKKKFDDLPDFQLDDIMGEFEKDDKGNFIIVREANFLRDKNKSRVNERGYLIDIHHNIINKEGQVVFKNSELDEFGEIPGPYGHIPDDLGENTEMDQTSNMYGSQTETYDINQQSSSGQPGRSQSRLKSQSSLSGSKKRASPTLSKHSDPKQSKIVRKKSTKRYGAKIVNADTTQDNLLPHDQYDMSQ